MRLPGTELANYADGLDVGQIAAMGQNFRAAVDKAGMLADDKVARGGIMGLQNFQQKKIAADANAYASGQAQQANTFGAVTGLIGTGLGIADGMGAFGGPKFPGTTSDGYPLGRGSDGKAYGGFGGQNGNFTPPTKLANGNYTFG